MGPVTHIQHYLSYCLADLNQAINTQIKLYLWKVVIMILVPDNSDWFSYSNHPSAYALPTHSIGGVLIDHFTGEC